ncbi:hypothetical protein D3C73_826320 [compost metagenome]
MNHNNLGDLILVQQLSLILQGSRLVLESAAVEMHNLLPLIRCQEILKWLVQHLFRRIAKHLGQRLISIFAHVILSNENSVLQIVDQLAVFLFRAFKLRIQAGIFQGEHHFPREQVDDPHPFFGEHAGYQIVLQIDDGNRLILVNQRHTDHRLWTVLDDIRIVHELRFGKSIIVDQRLPALLDLPQNGVGQILIPAAAVDNHRYFVLIR